MTLFSVGLVEVASAAPATATAGRPRAAATTTLDKRALRIRRRYIHRRRSVKALD
jgi:hypothetical protein